MNKIYRGEVPFRGDSMMFYDFGTRHGHSGITKKVIDPFCATLHLVNMERGRSAATSYWSHKEPPVDNTIPLGSLEYNYPMMFPDFIKIMRSMERGSLTGWWAARKQGSNYGLFYLGEGAPHDDE